MVERLGEAGCDDALVGIGQPGRLALEFNREAADADEAVRSALADVRRAVPSAKLIEVSAGVAIAIKQHVLMPSGCLQGRWPLSHRPGEG